MPQPTSPESTNKRFVVDAISAIAEARPSSLRSALEAAYHPDAEWRGSHPLNEMRGIDAIEARVWGPLLRSFPDLERRNLIVAGGSFNGTDLVATMGHYCGTFREDWLTIPATGRPIYLRSGEVHRIENGRITQSSVLIDVLDVIRQAGFWPIAPSLGIEQQWPAPIGPGAVSFEPSDPVISAQSIAQTLTMHGGIGSYEHDFDNPRHSYQNSSQQQYWHNKMMWYGPCGIGTVRGWQNYADYHAVPWITAFPDRRGAGHYIRIGDGPLSVTGGWPSVQATHTGGNFLGLGPTGRKLTIRVMDFYYHHEGIIRENWVPIDIIDMLRQMDVDVFARMHSFFGRGRWDDAPAGPAHTSSTGTSAA